MDANNSPNGCIKEIIIGLLVTIVGGIVVAWVIREGDLFQSHTSPIVESIPIALTNNYCAPQDYYVDGEPVASSIAENATVVFKVAPGDHWTYACAANTQSCGKSVLRTWTKATSHSIFPGPECPVTITLTNKYCAPQDFYVDGEPVASSIAENATVVFKVTPGEHWTYVCAANTQSCGDSVLHTWTEATTHSISPGPECP